MTSEIRTNRLTSRAGLSTVTLSDSGPVVTGIATFGTSINIGVTTIHSNLSELHHVVSTGVITATKFVGDISDATGAAAGLGTALSQDQSNPLNKLFYTDRVLSIGSTITVDHPASATGAYTQYADIQVEDNADLIVADGDDLIPDILGLGGNGTTGAGGAGRLLVDNIVNRSGSGAPTFPNGIDITDSIVHSGDTNTKIRFPEADAVTIETNGSERLRINSAGSWGIGSNFGTAGQVLTSQGSSSAPTWAAAGGITHAVTYRLYTDVQISGAPINPVTQWEIADNSFDGKLEDSNTWSLPSSGIFSFPVTGVYSVGLAIMMRHLNDSNAWCGAEINVSTDGGSSYAGASKIYSQIVQASGSSNQYVTAYCHAIIDVTNISQTKYKISFYSDQNESVTFNGATDDNRTSIKLIRLGDT